jgi:hypothetical protein
MSCKVEGCNNPSNYHYNPLISPLMELQGRIAKTFDQLPEEGKVTEVAKRIGYIAAAPFIYLGLALVALAGLILNGIWESKHISEIKKIKDETIEGLPCPEMIKALGGAEKVRNLPKIDWNGFLDPKLMTHPVMQGKHGGAPYFLFKYLKRDLETEEYIGALIQPYYKAQMEYIGWDNESGVWKGVYAEESELNLRVSSAKILKGSLGEKHMVDRVSRLMRGEPVGRLKRYSKTMIIKPENKNDYRPNDSYLKGEELEEYMDLETLFYEKELPPGTTEIQLVKK